MDVYDCTDREEFRKNHLACVLKLGRDDRCDSFLRDPSYNRLSPLWPRS